MINNRENKRNLIENLKFLWVEYISSDDNNIFSHTAQNIYLFMRINGLNVWVTICLY